MILINSNLRKKKIKNEFLLSFVIITMVTLVLSFTGCTKNDAISNSAYSDDQSKFQNSELKAEPTELRMLYKIWSAPLMDYVYYCAPPPFDCLPTVIITPDDKDKSFTNLMDIYEHFLFCLSEETMNAFFKDSESGYAKLFPYLKTDEGKFFLTYLQEEQYDVYQRFNSQEESDMFIVVPKGKISEDGLVENAVVTLQVKVTEY